MAITNSSFTANSAASHGGAIYNFDDTVTVTSSTFSGNNAAAGGAIFNNFGAGSAGSTILANSTGGNCYGNPITSQGSNLSDDDSCNLTGGPAQTMLLAANSDAIDTSDCALSSAEDQRGISRPQGSGCDIGSVELGRTSTYPLCVSYYTGAITSPLLGGCGAGQIELVVPCSLSFCIDPYTGAVSYTFGRPCTPPRLAHVLPDDGDLLTCVNVYIGTNRWVWNLDQCTVYGAPNTIPARADVCWNRWLRRRQPSTNDSCCL